MSESQIERQYNSVTRKCPRFFRLYLYLGQCTGRFFDDVYILDIVQTNRLSEIIWCFYINFPGHSKRYKSRIFLAKTQIGHCHEIFDYYLIIFRTLHVKMLILSERVCSVRYVDSCSALWTRIHGPKRFHNVEAPLKGCILLNLLLQLILL